MRRSIRLAGLWVSDGWFLWLHSFSEIPRVNLSILPDPSGGPFWSRIIRNWRHPWLFPRIILILRVGLVLEIAGNKTAVYMNVGFYPAYILIWIPGLIALLRGNTEAESVGYLVAFVGSALMILAVNLLLYRNLWRRTQTA